jgi:hypothetical protein
MPGMRRGATSMRRFWYAVLGLAAVALSARPAAAAEAKPDYATLSLQGQGHVQDSFALTVQAAARLLGREVDYDTVAALSVNCFSPGLDPKEDCTAWWGMYGRDRAMDIVAGRIGLRARPIVLPPAAADATPEQQLRAAASLLRSAIAAGEVVIADGGWKTDGPYGLNPWCWWGIVTQVRDDGAILGACLNGHRDNPAAAPATYWALSAAPPALTAADADRAMVERAVRRIRGEGPYKAGLGVAYGLDAMDLWIAKMRAVPYCGPCQKSAPDQVWTCATSTAQPVYEGAKLSAAALRRAESSFPEAARPYLENAAQHYDRIAELLAPYGTWSDQGGYRDIIGDLAKQQAHADAVLVPVKTELAAAADEMEQALRAAQPAVVLDGVSHGEGGNSYAVGLEAALRYCQTPADYDTIMGDTGQAFILQAEEGGPIVNGSVDVGWWPMAAWGIKARLGFLAQTVGRTIRVVDGNGDAFRADPAAHYARYLAHAVEASIAEGRPVLGEQDLCFVIAGYDGQAPPLLGDCALSTENKTTRDPDYPWGLIVFGERTKRLDRAAADREALRYAIALGHDEVNVAVPPTWEEWRQISGRFTGQKAFALWEQSLRDIEHPGEPRYQANMVLHLGINRRSAVAYLRAMAQRQPEAVAARLNAAADQYQQVLALLDQADTSPEAMAAAEGRERLAQLVARCAGMEAKATGELAQALAAMP